MIQKFERCIVVQISTCAICNFYYRVEVFLVSAVTEMLPISVCCLDFIKGCPCRLPGAHTLGTCASDAALALRHHHLDLHHKLGERHCWAPALLRKRFHAHGTVV